MNLSVLPLRAIESADRRVIGAFRFVDALTGAAIAVPARVEARHANVPGTPDPVLLPEGAVTIRQNRRGMYAIFRAPFFDTYIDTFENPSAPPGLQGQQLRLRITVLDAGAHYLPQEFHIDLPRSTDPAVEGSVFEPARVALYRSPAAPVEDGWAVLRVSVTRTGPDPAVRLAGVLVRAFAAPRANGAGPIGAGMTDWRGTVRGEALVPVRGVARFRAGAGENVVETEQELELEVTRDSRFTGAVDELPDVPRIEEGTGAGLVRPDNSELEMLRPAAPLRVRAGREYVVQLAMP